MRALRFALLAAVVFVLHLPAFAQSRRLMSGGAGGSRYYFFYDTFLDPAAPAVTDLGGGTLGGEGIIHRFMFDKGQRVYFGYDVRVEVLSEPNMYRVTFSRLTMSSENARQVLGADATRWTQLATPDWGGPSARIIQGGEVLALDLLRNNSTNQKIVDYVTVQASSTTPPGKLGPWPRDFIYETGTARDFRTDDAEIRIETEGFTLDGKVFPFNGGVSGPVVFMYAPGFGRFIFTLTPHPELGFVKAGEIRGSTVNFTVDAVEATIVSTGRVAPGSGPFNLYVLREPSWVPPGDASAPWIGAFERLDQLIGRF